MKSLRRFAILGLKTSRANRILEGWPFSSNFDAFVITDKHYAVRADVSLFRIIKALLGKIAVSWIFLKLLLYLTKLH